MRSCSLYTEEIDDLRLAAQELAQQLDKKMQLAKNTCAIMFCDIETEELRFLELFKQYYDFPVLCVTSVAMLESEIGYVDTGICLLVMTADDCDFQVGLTEEITADNLNCCISEAFGKLKCSDMEEKLVLCYAPIMPYFTGDEIVESFSKITKAPLFGGMASDGFTINDNRIAFDGISCRNRVGMIIVSGNVKPLFQREFSIVNTKDIMHEVTSSKRNEVYELEDKNFVEVLSKTGVNVSEEDVYLSFVGTVFEALVDVGNGEKVSVMRDLSVLNQEKRSGIFLGNVPEGSKMRLCLLNKDNISSSVKRSFVDIFNQISDTENYEYSTFLVSSCAGRFLLLSTEPEAEAKAYEDILPDNISLCGFYSYGEICPTYLASGNRYNVFHNKTFTLVAF